MKTAKNFLALLTLLALVQACDKSKLDLSDIVQTDGFGNITDRGSSNDWTLLDPDSNLPFFTALAADTFTFEGEPILPEGINFYCADDSVTLLVYPNPVAPGERYALNVSSPEKKILDLHMTYGPVNGEAHGRSSGLTPSTFYNNGHGAFIILGQEFNWPEGNTELWVHVLTEDSCAYFTYGKIMILD